MLPQQNRGLRRKNTIRAGCQSNLNILINLNVLNNLSILNNLTNLSNLRFLKIQNNFFSDSIFFYVKILPYLKKTISLHPQKKRR